MSGELLVVIDMQRAYMPCGAWETPGFTRAEGNILRLCEGYAQRVFTRHVPYADPPGTWRAYNEMFRAINEDAEAARLSPRLGRIAETVFDKSTYSALASGGLYEYIVRGGYGELLLCGVQSEFCVLATMMDAVDRGLPVALVTDACAGSTEALCRVPAEIAALMPCQVRLTTTEEALYGRD